MRKKPLFMSLKKLDKGHPQNIRLQGITSLQGYKIRRVRMFKETLELKALLEIASQLKKIRALLEEILKETKR